jgi:cobalt-zinc-cadmium efflux system outer membrane protein
MSDGSAPLPAKMKKLSLFPFVFMGLAYAQSSSLTLEQAIEEAMRNNLDLAAERQSLNVAEARQITAALRPNPVLTLQGLTLDLLGSGFNINSPAGPNQFNAHTDFVFERGGKRAERIAVAAEDRRLVELEIREAMRRLIADVQAGFVDVQHARAAVALAGENLRSLRGIVEVNENRVRTGDLAQVELDRSRVAAIQYETAVEQAKLQFEQARSRLQRLMGRVTAPADFDVTPEMRREGRDEPSEAILRRAIERRPDLAAVRQSQARSRAELRLQLANGKVDYVIGSEYSYQRAYGVGGSSLGLTFSVPLPVFNKNQGEIARAEREGRQYQARVSALEANISTEVDLAYRQYQTSERLLRNIETSLLSRAKTVRDVTEYSYRRGEATLVEFLDAQRAFNDSVQSYNEARATFARSLYLIDAVTGDAVASIQK